MRHWGVFVLVLFLLHQNEKLSNVSAQKGEFIKRRGVQFLLNGSPYYANGFNAYWLMSVASNPSQRNKVSSTFQEAVSNGLTVTRTWAFSDGGYQPLQSSPGTYNEQMFQGLDFVMYEAQRQGIKLILSMVNNYETYGGKKQYVNWARDQGQNITSDDDFFTNSAVKGFYKNHIKTVLTRRNSISGVEYKNDPTVMARELINEPRCTSDPSGTPCRLPGANKESQLSFTNNWINTHIQDSQTVLRKPILVAEFGWNKSSFDTNTRDQLLSSVYSGIYSSARRGGAAAGGMIWQLLAEGLDSMRDGYETVLTLKPKSLNCWCHF